MSLNWDNTNTDALAQAILCLRDKQEAKSFLRDLLTEKEIIEFGNRWQVAKLLSSNTPYSQIEKQTSMSSTTIARVNKFLTNGMNGYRLVISRQNHHHHTQASGESS